MPMGMFVILTTMQLAGVTPEVNRIEKAQGPLGPFLLSFSHFHAVFRKKIGRNNRL